MTFCYKLIYIWEKMGRRFFIHPKIVFVNVLEKIHEEKRHQLFIYFWKFEIGNCLCLHLFICNFLFNFLRGKVSLSVSSRVCKTSKMLSIIWWSPVFLGTTQNSPYFRVGCLSQEHHDWYYKLGMQPKRSLGRCETSRVNCGEGVCARFETNSWCLPCRMQSGSVPVEILYMLSKTLFLQLQRPACVFWISIIW